MGRFTMLRPKFAGEILHCKGDCEGVIGRIGNGGFVGGIVQVGFFAEIGLAAGRKISSLVPLAIGLLLVAHPFIGIFRLSMLSYRCDQPRPRRSGGTQPLILRRGEQIIRD